LDRLTLLYHHIYLDDLTKEGCEISSASTSYPLCLLSVVQEFQPSTELVLSCLNICCHRNNSYLP